MGVQNLDGLGGGGGGAAITVEEEGAPLATAAETLNFVGAGVTASGAGAEKTITIPGGTAGSVRIASGTTDTLASTDDNDTVVYTNAGAIEVAIPEGLSISAGIALQWLGSTGTITLNPGGAVLLNGSGSNLVLASDSGMVTITPVGVDSYNVVGATGDIEIPFGIQVSFKDSGADDTTVVDQYATHAYDIDATYSDCDSGTATYRLQINGVNVGTTANSVSSTEQEQLHSAANQVAIGDTVTLVRTANASCVNGRLKINCTRVL